MEFQVMKRISRAASTVDNSQDAKFYGELALKRRVTGYNVQGIRDELRTATFLRRISKFMVEALWNSIYSRMYRQMYLDPSKILSYGDKAVKIMDQCQDRAAAIDAIQEQAIKILELDPVKRSNSENLFVLGLFNQRNKFKDKFCLGWPSYEYSALCKKFKIIQVKTTRKVQLIKIMQFMFPSNYEVLLLNRLLKLKTRDLRRS
jgi:hypothetical protein